jgi:dTDP-glucose 4,6-dehydratase
MSTHILITGAAGFIASNFVHYLLDEHDDIRITSLDSLTYAGSKRNLDSVLDDSRHKFVKGDIRDEDLLADLAQNVDVIVNFAAESHVDNSIENPEPFVSTNIQGTRALLDAALESDVDRFLQISTDEVYGEILKGRSSEDDRLVPRNPYAATKASADLLAKSYETTYGLPVIITRTSNNFGPRQHTEKLIPKFITKAATGETLPIYGDGMNVREWTFVADNCRALDLILRKGNVGEIYNIGSREEKTNLEVTKTILDVVGGSEEQITFVEDRPGHDQRYALDTAKIEALGWEPQWSFEEGIRQTADYYLSEE